ncbi:MAG: hypothetical protein ACW9W3_02000 [Candidatus Nitrosopumilus sp. bin_68KS]
MMQNVSKDSDFGISQEFIESGKHIHSKKKKGGPYSKDEKIKRQNEVYRLHFDYGYSARKISDMMNINRNTINGDIDYWYDKIIVNTNYLNLEGSIMISRDRLEIQRIRLREKLDKIENFQQQYAIEKMIFEIEGKIININLKLAESEKRINKEKINFLNNHMEKKGEDLRFISLFDKISVSEKSYNKISKIIKEDRNRNIR